MTALSWRQGSVDVDGVKIAYEVTGEGPTMLLIMGLATQCIFWPDEFCADLVARGYRVVRFDNRDVGLSGSVNRGVPVRITRDFLRSRIGIKVESNYTLFDMVKDTLGLLDHLGVDRVHIVGISMGGIIGQMLAADHPERVLTLSLIMSHTNHSLFGAPHPRVILAMGPPPAGATRAQIVERNVKAFQVLGSPAYRRTDDELRFAFTTAYDRDNRVDGVERQTHALFATGCIDGMLGRIRAPTTVMHGLSDLLVLPINAKRIAARIAGARVTTFPGMGHDFPRALLPRWAQLIGDNAVRPH
ncbi:MAG: alpha/beta hydrolase [Deltaproteobacteria bacterium]|nr:alpha/beta hydrolase [Deltaproteobacteria bacterium]